MTTQGSENPVEQASPGPEAEAPAPITPEAPDSGQAPSGSTEPPSFSEGSFDPNSLPDDLRPVYRQMQAAYTQKTQSLAQQRKEAEAAMAFMQALQDEENRVEALRELAEYVGADAYLTAAGYEFEGEDDEDPGFDQGPVTDPRLEEIVQWRDQLLAEQQETALISEIESYTETEFDRLGIEDEGLRELVLGRATVYDLDENGMPQIQQAWNDVNALLDAQQKNWIKSKQAPRGPVSGQPGQEEEYDFHDPEARQLALARRLEASSNSGSS